MMIKKSCLAVTIFLLVFVVARAEETAVFLNNLSLGMNSSDIFKLQQMLNTDADTKVADIGPGSPGNETSYFGLKTKDAVKRFQQKFSSEVLTPAGLSFGTGFVGEFTRKKLNSLEVSLEKVSNKTVNTAKNTNISNLFKTSPISKEPVLQGVVSVLDDDRLSGVVSPEALFTQVNSTDVILTSISSNYVAQGDIVTIKGKGFLSQNVLHIGNNYSVFLSAPDGVSNIKIPNISKGSYEVWVENSNGSSRDVSPQYITVSDKTIARPHLSSSSPLDVSETSKITVVGTNFDSSGNTINSSLGTIEGVPSQNGRIVFSVSDLPEAKEIASKGFPDGMPVTYSIKNSKGQSSNFGRFTFSSSFAKKEKKPFDKFMAFLQQALYSVSGTDTALAAFRNFDGGKIKRVKVNCTCSGSKDISVESYVDNKEHEYIYQPGRTELYENYNITKAGEYDLTTLYPYGTCLVVRGEECDKEGNPEGTFAKVGTS